MEQWAGVLALGEFCIEFWQTTQEEKAHAELWDIWLHKDFEHNWEDFKAELNRRAKILNMTDDDKSDIIAQSFEILESFQPN